MNFGMWLWACSTQEGAGLEVEGGVAGDYSSPELSRPEALN